MATGFQSSLFAQGELIRPRTVSNKSIEFLEDGAWIGHHPSWLEGADELFFRLKNRVLWEQDRRPMYDKFVIVPRLHAFFEDASHVLDGELTPLMTSISDLYSTQMNERLSSVGLCFYRSGDDSVAWHGDTIGKGATEDTVIAILSLGATRTLSFRKAPNGKARQINMSSGDLFVMGGSAQRKYEHAILKTKRLVGPRISVQFRCPGVA